MTTKRETIEWRAPVADPPPVDELVLVCFIDGRRPEVYLGYQDQDDVWRDQSGTEYKRVLAWARLPVGVPA